MGMGRDEDWDDTVGFGACMQLDNSSGELKWKMRNGRTILITDMTNSHLCRTLRMLQRNGSTPPQLSVLLEEARARNLRW